MCSDAGESEEDMTFAVRWRDDSKVEIVISIRLEYAKGMTGTSSQRYDTRCLNPVAGFLLMAHSGVGRHIRSTNTQIHLP